MESRLEREEREFAYRIFVTDCLGKICGLKTRYYDIVSEHPVETRSADDIIVDIRMKLAKIGGE